jgi:hypothetical protein
MAGVPDQQQPPGPVDGKDRYGRQQDQVVSDGGPQPRYVLGDGHLRNPTMQAGSPMRSGAAFGCLTWSVL